MTEPTLPIARLARKRRVSFAWIVPIAAFVFAAVLVYQSWSIRGTSITVQLDDGYGLKVGDDVRYRGISVGVVDSISLLPTSQVEVHARIKPDANNLLRAGTQFWVVRPRLRLTGIEGLETVIGPRYLALQPPTHETTPAARQRTFVGLNQAPLVDSLSPGDLEIVVQSPQRGSLHPGAPVTYRQTRVGTIMSVGIASDAGSVEARVHIQQSFVQLIRPNTRFWDVGGIEAKLGLTGLTVNVESAEALLNGGLALATPPPSEAGGDVVRTGHRFQLSPKPDPDWLQWQPQVAIGSSLLPPGVSPPSPLRAVIGWKQGRWFKGERRNHGWVLQTNQGLLGPTDLLKPGDRADADTVVLEVAGRIVPLDAPLAWEGQGLGMLPAQIASPQWKLNNDRAADAPEDCLIFTDPTAPPLPIAAARISISEERWKIDPSVTIPPGMHGGCAVSRSDGSLLGILIIEDDVASISLIAKTRNPK